MKRPPLGEWRAPQRLSSREERGERTATDSLATGSISTLGTLPLPVRAKSTGVAEKEVAFDDPQTDRSLSEHESQTTCG